MNQSVLVDDYVNALMTTIRNDDTYSPTPEDFTSRDAYSHWNAHVDQRLQDMIVKMLKDRFFNKDVKVVDPVEIKIKIIEARGLVEKQGKVPKRYCNIEYGDLTKKSKHRDRFRTDVVENVWNQNMTVEAKSLTDDIRIECFDQNKDARKDYFLGSVVIKMSDLISQAARVGEFEKWYTFQTRDSKYKDKYVGGEILVGFALIDREQVLFDN